MKTVLILLAALAVGAAIFGIRAYNRAVKRELEPTSDTPSATAAEPQVPMPSFTDLSAQEAQQFIAEHPDATVLDVRTPPECAGGIIEGALMIPMQNLQGREGEIPEGPVLVYCAVGARSAAVADYLVKLGRTDVYNLDGGMMGWSGPTVRP